MAMTSLVRWAMIAAAWLPSMIMGLVIMLAGLYLVYGRMRSMLVESHRSCYCRWSFFTDLNQANAIAAGEIRQGSSQQRQACPFGLLQAGVMGALRDVAPLAGKELIATLLLQC
jgi:hypothetical protein